MNNQEARELSLKAFVLIEKAECIEDIKNIQDVLKIPIKNRMDINSYPKINFSINASEIVTLMSSDLIGKDLNICHDFSSKINTPLEKLMYAVLWKNGDLKKIKHIIKGINDTKNIDVEEGIVFHQFGKFLTGRLGEPIIDQHVIRAFAIYQHDNDNEISNYRKLKILKKNHLPIIRSYKEWLNGPKIRTKLKTYRDYSYYVDQLLFAVGKTIKRQVPTVDRI